MKKRSRWIISIMGIILCFLYVSTPTFASTNSGITVTKVSSSSSAYAAGVTFTLTGSNLPILSNSNGTPATPYPGESAVGYDFPNFALVNLGYAWEAGNSLTGMDSGIFITNSTTTQLQFYTEFPTSDGAVFSIYLAPGGQSFSGSAGGYAHPPSQYLVGDFNISTGIWVEGITQTPMLQLISTTSASATLTWNAVPYATSYNIYENGSSSPVETGITATTTTISGLTSGQTYSFEVAGVNALGIGPSSSAVSVVPSLLEAPVLSISSESDGTLNLTWIAVANAVSYEIDVNGHPYVSDVKQTYLTLSNLPLNSPDTITVYGMDENGNPGSPSTPQTATPELAGPQLSYSKLTTKSITLNWSPVTGATSYQVYEGDPTLVATTSGTSTTIAGLSAGQPYSFTVQAVTPNGNSLTSAPVSVHVPILYLPFSGTDILNSALALLLTFSGILLLAMVIEFAPHLLNLVRRSLNSPKSNLNEYDREWTTFEASSCEEIQPVSSEEWESR